MTTRAAQPGRFSRHSAHGARPENDYRFAAAHVAPVDGQIAGGKDIGQEQGLVIGERIRNSPGPKVGVGYAHVLSLAAVVAAVQVGVAKQGPAFFGQ